MVRVVPYGPTNKPCSDDAVNAPSLRLEIESQHRAIAANFDNPTADGLKLADWNAYGSGYHVRAELNATGEGRQWDMVMVSPQARWAQ
eukprot:scaffold32_cov368-Prasinococcus_capsulatus_cf.AAC.4